MREDLLQANAELTISLLRPLSDIDFGYNAESVEWVQGYIDRLRQRGQLEDKREKLISVLGSFLGECIVRCHGGQWVQRQDGLGVTVAGLTFYPFEKTRLQMENGLEDGIAALFECIPLMARRHEAGQVIDLSVEDHGEGDRSSRLV
jgi:hypothetical protein